MSERSREVEGVLLVRADDQEAAGDRVAALNVVDRFELRARSALRIRDVYLDTDGGALAGSRVAFRLREQVGEALTAELSDDLASRRLDPYQAAERLLERMAGRRATAAE